MSGGYRHRNRSLSNQSERQVATEMRSQKRGEIECLLSNIRSKLTLRDNVKYYEQKTDHGIISYH